MDNLFIGTKRVLATPMTRKEYNDKRGWDIPEEEKGMEDDAGFMVEDLDGGKSNTEFSEFYVSWSPKDVFEESYESVDVAAMSFGQAVEMMKKGKAVARVGWNGKGMFLYHVGANSYPAQTGVAKDVWKNKKVPYGAYIAMKTAQGNVVPWLASQTDILANDWQITTAKK